MADEIPEKGGYPEAVAYRAALRVLSLARSDRELTQKILNLRDNDIYSQEFEFLGFLGAVLLLPAIGTAIRKYLSHACAKNTSWCIREN